MNQIAPLLVAGALSFLAVLAPGAAGDTYPSKPIKLVVPWPAGSNSGTWARLIAEPLGKKLGQPVIIEHKPGATGTIGGAIVAKSKPDGYTLLYGITADQTIAPHVLRNMSYDPRSAFAPVAQLLEAPVVMITHPSVNVSNLHDLISLARTKPGQLTFGTVGIGSQGHLFWEMLMQRAGIQLTHIPYKGQSELMPDLLEGRIQLTYLWPHMAIEHVKTQRLNILMTTNARRLAVLPGTPTASEAGFPEFTVAVWAGLFAPAGTPLEVIRTLNSAIQKVMAEPRLRDAMARADAQVRTSSPEELAALIRTEWERWGKVVKAAKIQAE